MARSLRVFVLAAGVVLTPAILPAALPAGTPPQAALPDFWSGSWPAELMPSEEALGTLTFRQIDEREGRAAIGQPFGGLPFEGCDPARSIFYRGHYNTGGDLIACTVGPDARTLVGRFNGREDFRSGSFTVAIVSDGPREFRGKYFEDGGATLDWCGDQAGAPLPAAPIASDSTPPSVAVLASGGRSGSLVRLRLRVSEDSGSARVQVTIRRGARVLGSLSREVATASGAVSLTWRAPHAVRGRLTFCAQAWDGSGNMSARSCAALTLA